MKRVITFVVLFMSILAVNAQEDILHLDNGFKTSGSMDMFWESEDESDAYPVDDGSRWHLEIQDDIITFWIDVPKLALYSLNLTKWELGKNCASLHRNDGLKMYLVFDSNCRHLGIIEYEKNKWLVQLCTVCL